MSAAKGVIKFDAQKTLIMHTTGWLPSPKYSLQLSCSARVPRSPTEASLQPEFCPRNPISVFCFDVGPSCHGNQSH